MTPVCVVQDVTKGMENRMPRLTVDFMVLGFCLGKCLHLVHLRRGFYMPPSTADGDSSVGGRKNLLRTTKPPLAVE